MAVVSDAEEILSETYQKRGHGLNAVPSEGRWRGEDEEEKDLYK